MNENNWDEVDRFIADLFVNPDPALDAALCGEREGRPAGDRGLGASRQAPDAACEDDRRARRILEIGTLGGYSTIWLARALPKTAS